MGVGRVGIVRGKKDDRQILINQGIRPVLHLPRGIPFRMNIGKFFQVERSFESDRKMNAARQEEKIVLAEESFRNVLDAFGVIENPLHLLRKFGEIRKSRSNIRVRSCLVQLRQVQSDQIQAGQLGGKS